jgi:hypothetical protein
MTWNLKGNYIPKSAQRPSGVQLAAWTGDPMLMPSVLPPATGSIYFVRAYVDNPVTCTHMYTWITTAGSGMSNSFFGVYQATSGGTRLAVSADVSTSLTSTGLVTIPISSLSGLTYNQELWLAVVIGSGTPPNFTSVRQYGTNIGQSSDYRLWKGTATGQTSLPSTAPAMSPPALGYHFMALGA